MENFRPPGITNLFSILKDYALLLSNHGIKPSEVLVSATECFRVASDGNQVADSIQDQFGLKVKILTAQEEAFFAAKGIALNIGTAEQSVVILDIGGASTELISLNLKPFKLQTSVSFPVGAVRASEWLEDQSLYDKLNTAEKLSSANVHQYRTTELLCVAGTMTSVANLLEGNTDKFEKKINNQVYQVDQFRNLLKRLECRNFEFILAEFPFLGKRAQSLVGGMKVAEWIFSLLDVERFRVSTFGLRYGTIFQKAEQF